MQFRVLPRGSGATPLNAMNTEQERDELISEITQLIDRKIKAHEIRVGWISGIIGLVFLGSVAAFLYRMHLLVSQ